MKNSFRVISIILIGLILLSATGCYIGKVYQPKISQDELRKLKGFEEERMVKVILIDSLGYKRTEYSALLYKIQEDSLVIFKGYSLFGFEPRKVKAFPYSDIECVRYRFSGVLLVVGLIPLSVLAVWGLFELAVTSSI